MVYFGPSRGCLTCKKRRKKCDETRPSCLRCTTSQRTCGGYEDGPDRMFRQYEKQEADSSQPKSSARKCSLPVRANGPTSDVLPQEIQDEKVEEYALRAFFYDYCVVSTNRSLSRGYLDGLENMVNRLGWQSDLAKACKVVAFACQGNKLSRPTTLTRRAEMHYQELLGSLAGAIANLASANVVESLVIAMLLGLYEMIMAGITEPGNHKAHAGGIAAILRIDNSPLDLLSVARSFRSKYQPVTSPTNENCGVFPGAYSNISSQHLDDLIIAFGKLWGKGSDLLVDHIPKQDDLHQLRSEVISLDQSIKNWQDTQIKDFKPWIVGHVNEPQTNTKANVGCWPGKVETYFDIYVASVWNTSRTIRILLISMLRELSRRADEPFDEVTAQHELCGLFGDILSSVPFHLAEDLQSFIREAGTGNGIGIAHPGRSAGGLLLMHPLYVISKLSNISPVVQEYARDSLEWIALRMGIGQASFFAKAPLIQEDYFIDGCTIIWAGMLV